MKNAFPQLVDFQKSARALAQLLDENPSLPYEDQLSVENHLQIVQLAYAAWLSRFRNERLK